MEIWGPCSTVVVYVEKKRASFCTVSSNLNYLVEVKRNRDKEPDWHVTPEEMPLRFICGFGSTQEAFIYCKGYNIF